MVFGGVCPSVTSTIAQSVQNWNLVQLSFAASAAVLADRERYPNFFCTIPSDAAVSRSVVRILSQYRWSRVGVLTDGQNILEKDLTTKLREAKIDVAIIERLSNSTCIHLKKLKDNDVRIIIGLFDEKLASKVFCCVHNLNMFGRKYQWILPSGYKQGWWEDSNISTCSSKSLLIAIEGYISVDLKHLSDRQIKGISGRTPQEYEGEYKQQLWQQRLVGSKLHGFAYDGVWAIALALTQVMESIKHRERHNIHRNFTVSNTELEQMVLHSIKQLQFEGVTGPVFFRNGQRMGSLKLSQLQGGQEVEVGLYNTSTEVLQLTRRMRFQGAGPARDRTTVRLLRKGVSLPLYSILSATTGLAIITAIGFFCLNIKNRTHRLMKTSGLFLDNLIFLGTILSFTSIFLFGLDRSLVSDHDLQILCSVRTWFLSIGHSITFAALLAKIWRVYMNMEMNKSSKARDPVKVVGMLLFADLAILTCWQVVDPLRHTESESGWETDPSDEDIVIRPFITCCESRRMNLWLTIMYAYKGPVMLLGCFLAWSTRKVQEPPLNDSVYLVGSVLILTVLCVCGVSGYHLTSHQPGVQFCVLAVAILLCNTSIICLLFLPKILNIRNSPVEASQTTGVQSPPKQKESGSCTVTDQDRTRDLQTTDENETASLLDNLQIENQHLCGQITQLDAELKILAVQLQENPEQEPSPQDAHMAQRGSSGYFRETSGEGRSLVQLEQQDPNQEDVFQSLPDINSPEHVQRRMSVQLPILHHAYLPVIGGVNASCSSLLSQA
ncbi:gamma-aminobutyric acid type B receptor subunit 2-like [Osmerus mordax]|uniref:gamma-aminobutyric acid type B receptor subunit 2-like n=1 Tax=Osmerus mordax TaxID=8014 RepID=UPI00350EE12A